MVSVSKLDDDEESSIIIIASEKEFKKIAKLFRKRTGYNIDELYSITKLSHSTYKLEPKLDFLNDTSVEDLAKVMAEIIKDIGNYRVSIDGLIILLKKLSDNKVSMTKQLRYSLKLAGELLNKPILLMTLRHT